MTDLDQERNFDDDDNDDDDDNGMMCGYEAVIMGADDVDESSQPIKRLADALHDCVEPPGRQERTERLASALQACLNHAVEAGAQRTREEWGPRFDHQDETIRLMREHMDTRLDRQDDTLRLMWRHMKGNGKLPIDE